MHRLSIGVLFRSSHPKTRAEKEMQLRRSFPVIEWANPDGSHASRVGWPCETPNGESLD